MVPRGRSARTRAGPQLEALSGYRSVVAAGPDCCRRASAPRQHLYIFRYLSPQFDVVNERLCRREGEDIIRENCRMVVFRQCGCTSGLRRRLCDSRVLLHMPAPPSSPPDSCVSCCHGSLLIPSLFSRRLYCCGGAISIRH